MSSFTQKLMRATLTKANGFGSAGSGNTVSFGISPTTSAPPGSTQLGVRMAAEITNDGAAPLLSLQVWGLPPATMNALSTFGKVSDLAQLGSTVGVALEAGDTSRGLALLYSGVVTQAWQDFNNAPETLFHIMSVSTLAAQITAAPPRSYSGQTDVAVVMQSLATQMGLKFENTGVSGVYLTDPYLPGTAMQQMRRAARAAGINAIVDNDTLAICPHGMPRGGSVPLISPTTGMIGYPAHMPTGRIAVRTMYNPSIKYMGQVIIQGSSIPQANGQFMVWQLSHELESFSAGGKWETRFEAVSPNYIGV